MPTSGQQYVPVPNSDVAEEAITVPESPRKHTPTALQGQRENASPTGSHTSGSSGSKSPTKSLLGVATDFLDSRDSNMPPRFIKLVGVPPPNSDGSVTNQPIDVSDEDSRNHIMDILDADDEDPFSLDSFESLLISHARKGRDFILARVATVDPNDENRFYYSYYAAHHINKVLFRTQPEEGLLHRMRAKNPLNNMTIVGDVHYYVISAMHAKERIKELLKYTKPQSPLAKISTLIGGAVFGPGIYKLSEADDRPFVVTGTNSSNSPFRNHFRSKSGGTPTAPTESIQRFLGQLSGQTRGKKTIRLIARPEAFEPEEHELAGPSVSTKHDPKPPSSSQSKAAVPATDEIITDSNSTAKSKVLNRVRKNTATRTDSRRSSFDDAFKDPAPSTPAASTLRPVAGDTIESPTQTQMELDLQRHRKVRSHAYCNECNESMNVGDWVRMQAKSKSRSNHPSPDRSHPQNAPDSVSPRKPGKIETDPSSQPEFFFEAVYYASDDDFLMKSTVRAFFRENALETSDAVLFTIGGSSEPGNQPNTSQHPALLNFMYSVNENQTDNRPTRRDSMTLLMWAVVAYAVPAFFIVKFVVPVQYTILSAFILLFLFCMILIVIV